MNNQAKEIAKLSGRVAEKVDYGVLPFLAPFRDIVNSLANFHGVFPDERRQITIVFTLCDEKAKGGYLM